MKLINRNLLKFLGIAFAFSTAILLLTYKFWPVLTHNTIYYCKSFLSGSLIRVPHSLHIGTVIFLALFFTVVLARLLFVIIKGNKFKKHLSNKSEVSEKIAPILQELKLTKFVTVVKDTNPFAFCLGIRNPHIYISTETIKMMTESELKAILIHEKYHLDKKDGLIMQIASLTKIIFPFFPVISDFIQGYRLDREIRADREVIFTLGRQPLVNVLTKLLNFPTVPMLTASAIADADTIEARIKALSQNKNTGAKYKKVNLLISLTTLTIFILFLVIPVQASEIHTNGNDMTMICVNDDHCAALCQKNATAINTRVEKTYSQNVNYPYSAFK
ncbi:MAG TPA: M56 family metallopeptidase [Chitinophagaceae bacterium]|nr:M56 family metallopeptidase [Chitinophagaceae bacterium]